MEGEGEWVGVEEGEGEGEGEWVGVEEGEGEGEGEGVEEGQVEVAGRLLLNSLSCQTRRVCPHRLLALASGVQPLH